MEPRRSKTLKAIRKFKPLHRYVFWRLVGLGTSFGILVLIPVTGLVRVDLWRGDHRLFFEPASFNHALAGLIVAFCLIYAVTFLINIVAARMFCGWGCPIGHLHRLSELNGLKYWIFTGCFALLLPLSVIVWWSDWRVFYLGSPNALILVWSLLIAGATAALLHGKFIRWDFCMKACPIGLYYSFVAPARWFGITFQNTQNCIECNQCDYICPVDLKPRTLIDPEPYRGGISIADAPGRNHCLECGDCVRACEWIVEKQTGAIPPLKLGFHNLSPQPQEERHASNANP